MSGTVLGIAVNRTAKLPVFMEYIFLREGREQRIKFISKIHSDGDNDRKRTKIESAGWGNCYFK